MDSDYKLTQTELHEFAIHDKPAGALRATIAREASGSWSTREPEQGGQHASPQEFDDQSSPQTAFAAWTQAQRAPDPES
ncbi:hypothetical protein [Herbiconiux sp.]|uniref:hypothetical protein n=1 Tax=Herbiconiux sp. TaxID=1871186 RepID=UPI0025BC247D|nr:hypothetical protein [Herbiconiux sp.]